MDRDLKELLEFAQEMFDFEPKDVLVFIKQIELTAKEAIKENPSLKNNIDSLFEISVATAYQRNHTMASELMTSKISKIDCEVINNPQQLKKDLGLKIYISHNIDYLNEVIDNHNYQKNQT